MKGNEQGIFNTIKENRINNNNIEFEFLFNNNEANNKLIAFLC
jgi:hypothetical protein